MSLTPHLVVMLEDPDKIAILIPSRHGGAEDEGSDSGELDKDVKSRARGILHGVTHSVTDDSSLVLVRSLTGNLDSDDFTVNLI